jgi:hypothetical protein
VASGAVLADEMQRDISDVRAAAVKSFEYRRHESSGSRAQKEEGIQAVTVLL